VNSSLTLSESPRACANAKWWARQGLPPQIKQSWLATYRKCALLRARLVVAMANWLLSMANPRPIRDGRNADEAAGWNGLQSKYEMKRINHQEAYSDGEACTNMAESFFSRLRRGEMGHFHHVSGPYAPRHDFAEALRATLNWYIANEPWWRAVLDRSYQR